MGCESCTNKELAAEYNTIQQQAKEYAIANDTNTVIYKMDDGHYAYIDAKAAFDSGIQPIQFVSKLRPVTT